jgi:hypothetical protein
MIYDVSKIGAAVDQLDWAIRLFLDHQAYVPAITLAGAAEEILGEAVGGQSMFNILKTKLSQELSLPPQVVSQKHLNHTKNWLKHWKDLKDAETIPLDLETEAIAAIIRGIGNLATHDQSLSSGSPRFMAWLPANRPDLYAA